ncbi:unnamed protein product [Coregonus sp. 'balchen']|nr:unnamed protein product [Coregonus sp. 'balchen']
MAEKHKTGLSGSHAPASSSGSHAPALSSGSHAPAGSTGSHAPAGSMGSHAPAGSMGSHAPAGTTGSLASAETIGPLLVPGPVPLVGVLWLESHQCNHFQEADDHHSLEGIRQEEGQPATSAAAKREDCITKPGQRIKTKMLSIHEKLDMEFHERKLMYLKEEHDLKMQILHVELAMKEEERNMKQQQYQCSSRSSTSSGSRYFHL